MYIKKYCEKHSISLKEHKLEATGAIYSKYHNQIWLVGDCRAVYDGHKIDNELKRISLSLKRMGENPWQQIEGQFEEGQVVKGTVNKVTTFGAFINIFPGVEALLPVAEMSDENVNPFSHNRAYF